MTSAVECGARYSAMFQRLQKRDEGAFIPFAMLGDPAPGRCLQAITTLCSAGADGLELGLPYSDPIADGPVIQAAASRALKGGVRRGECWAIVKQIRDQFPELPIGILVYANLVFHSGDPECFYADAAAAGVDSVLIADVPVSEAVAPSAVARSYGIAPVLIAPPNADDARLAAIAAASAGYTYVTSREGVTGADNRLCVDQNGVMSRLRRIGAPPPVLGFGISTPSQVRAAIEMGAAGVISGSAIVKRIAEGDDLGGFVSEMKAATRNR